MPGQEARPLSRSARPRLYLVDADTEPPITSDPLEDWAYVSADASDVAARIERLRARSARSRVVIDAHGRLGTDAGWVALSPLQVVLMSELVGRFGTVVGRDTLGDALWSTGSRRIGNNLGVQLFRLRGRIKPLGLSLRTVRGRGYVLDHEVSSQLS
jgi:DNA-binding response OmpR family regulator